MLELHSPVLQGLLPYEGLQDDMGRRACISLHAALSPLSHAGKPFAALLGPSMTGGDAGGYHVGRCDY